MGVFSSNLAIIMMWHNDLTCHICTELALEGVYQMHRKCVQARSIIISIVSQDKKVLFLFDPPLRIN